MKYLHSLIVFLSASLIFTSYGCNKCDTPVIVFDPVAATVDKNPGQQFTVNIAVTGKDNISSIAISKTANGSPKSNFMSVMDIGSKSKTVTLVDSVPVAMVYGSVITYTITATSDCKKTSAFVIKTFTVTVTPSSAKLDDLFYLVENSQAPRLYSRFTIDPTLNPAWDLQNRAAKTDTAKNANRDIQDSVPSINPFGTAARWGSRNGTKFVKAPSGFDFTNASAKSIIDGYKAGTPTDLITFAAGDYIFVNIKNSNRYAVIRIKSFYDNGNVSNDDYTFFSYKLAQ